MKWLLPMCVIFICFGLNPGCSKYSDEPLLLFDFESDADLDRLHWKCRTLFSLSDLYNSHGERSLMMEMYPSDYPGMSVKLNRNDWRQYQRLCFEVFNPESQEIAIAVRIDDRKKYPAYGDRFNRRILLKPRENRICVPFDQLNTSDQKRKLDLSNIYRLIVFMVEPIKKHTLFVDHVRLENLATDSHGRTQTD